MSINFTTKNVKMPGALKAYIEKHLLDIEKIAGDIIDAEVIINEEKLSFKVEISLKTRLNSFYAEDRNKILKQAVRNTLDTLRSQAKKSKEKLKEEKKRPGPRAFFKRTLGLVPAKRSERRDAASRRKRAQRPQAHPHLRQFFAQADHGRGSGLFPERERGERLHVHQFGDQSHGRRLSATPRAASR